ncbi:MAG: hypothetical protein ACI35S_00575 [Anaeroplasma sp.]
MIVIDLDKALTVTIKVLIVACIGKYVFNTYKKVEKKLEEEQKEKEQTGE